jgi:hypothetical protein
VPTGVAVFPLDVSIRRTIELEHTVVHWSEFGRGGHFAAMEAPDLLVDDVREFFSKLRGNHNGADLDQVSTERPASSRTSSRPK